MKNRNYRRLEWFRYAHLGWQGDARHGLSEVFEEYGRTPAAEAYIGKRLKNALLTSFERLRWFYIRKLYR